jgi:hypothetical protein
MINREDKRIIEAPIKYQEEWVNSFMGDDIKMWYTGDLISLYDTGYLSKRETFENENYWLEWCELYGIEMSVKELKEYIEQFTIEERKEIMEYLKGSFKINDYIKYIES